MSAFSQSPSCNSKSRPVTSKPQVVSPKKVMDLASPLKKTSPRKSQPPSRAPSPPKMYRNITYIPSRDGPANTASSTSSITPVVSRPVTNVSIPVGALAASPRPRAQAVVSAGPTPGTQVISYIVRSPTAAPGTVYRAASPITQAHYQQYQQHRQAQYTAAVNAAAASMLAAKEGKPQPATASQPPPPTTPPPAIAASALQPPPPPTPAPTTPTVKMAVSPAHSAVSIQDYVSAPPSPASEPMEVAFSNHFAQSPTPTTASSGSRANSPWREKAPQPINPHAPVVPTSTFTPEMDSHLKNFLMAKDRHMADRIRSANRRADSARLLSEALRHRSPSSGQSMDEFLTQAAASIDQHLLAKDRAGVYEPRMYGAVDFATTLARDLLIRNIQLEADAVKAETAMDQAEQELRSVERAVFGKAKLSRAETLKNINIVFSSTDDR